MQRDLPFIIMSLFFAVQLSAQTKVAIEDAAKHIGKQVTISAKVYSATRVINAGSIRTNLIMGAAYPNQKLTVVINERDRENFRPSLENLYMNKQISVTGKVTENNGRPEIVVDDRRDITVANNSEGGMDLWPNDIGNFIRFY